jgi:hypothetical protein
VSTNSKETGLLLLPDGASSWDLRPLQVFRDYALENAEKWYEFVNGTCRRMVGDGDLYLVTGVTKSTSWGVAALKNHSGEGQISLKLKAALVGNAGATYSWKWESGGSSVNSGPWREPGEEEWRDNQTVFLRGFKVMLRSRLRKKLKPKLGLVVYYTQRCQSQPLPSSFSLAALSLSSRWRARTLLDPGTHIYRIIY